MFVSSRSVGILILLAVLTLASCGGQASARIERAGNEWPKQLRFLISISDENPEVEASRLRPIGDYLESQLHMPVEVIGSTGYGVAIEALRAHKIEACTTGPFAYLIASERAGAEVIAMRGSLDGVSNGYSGGIAVAAGSPLHSMEDLIAQAKRLSISFVDPASASGYLVQRIHLDSLGIDPQTAFKKTMFSQNHVVSSLALLAGKTDVAAIGLKVVPSLVHSGQIREGAIRFIWTSPPIPEGPVAVRKDLPQSFKDRLREALLEMKAKAPDAYANMTAKVFIERYRNTKFVAASDALFEPLRAMARGVKQTSLLDPE